MRLLAEKMVGRRTRVDGTYFIREMLEERYPDAKKVVLVMDNLNTHNIASLYTAFPADLARSLADRLEIHHTLKHGSWLNIAEIELSVLERQCLAGRIACIEKDERQRGMSIEIISKQKLTGNFAPIMHG